MILNETAKLHRRAFRQRYGVIQAGIVEYIMRGWNNHRIANKFNVSERSVRTTKGNITRGFYDDWLKSCNF